MKENEEKINNSNTEKEHSPSLEESTYYNPLKNDWNVELNVPKIKIGQNIPTKKELPKKLEDEVKENDNSDNALIKDLSSANSDEMLSKIIQMFNTNQTKKNMLRVIKQNDLLDKILNQAGERISKRPDEITTKELIDYMNALQANIEKSQKLINQVEDTPLIQINNNKNEINLNVEQHSLPRESREKILDAVNKILNSSDNVVDEATVIDSED